MEQKKFLTLILLTIALFFNYQIQAQNPLTTTSLGITLQCAGGGSERSGVAFNPTQQLYYSVNAGSSNYPIETFNISGTQVSTNGQGFDYRGVWWNPNTDNLEGNGYSTYGINIQNLDSNFYALGTGTIDIANSSGPDNQSCGTYDYDEDRIYYYKDSAIYCYYRSSHSLDTTISITGLPVVATNLNDNSLAYTGITGMEIGLYDYVDKAFYYINKATGEYVTKCQLPATAPAANSFNIGFGNNNIWLFNRTLLKWEGYAVVNPCNLAQTDFVDIEMDDSFVSVTMPSGTIISEEGVYQDTVRNSLECDSVISTFTLTKVTVGINDLTFENISIFPNPTNGIVSLNVSETLSSIRIIDLAGKTIQVFKADAKQLDITAFTQGIYFLEIANAERKSVVKIVKR